MNDSCTVKILYTNYKGVTSIRTIIPKQIVFSKNEWHPVEQWILIAQDLEKNAERSFAMKDIKSWWVEHDQ